MAALPQRKPTTIPEASPTQAVVVFDGMSYQLDGQAIKHDLLFYLDKAKSLRASFDTEPVDDDEIAARNIQVGKIKDARAKLKTICSEVTAQYVSLDEFNRIAKELDGVLQKTQSLGEDQVKNSKARKIAEISASQMKAFDDGIAAMHKEIHPLLLNNIAKPDFEKAFKNLKSIRTIENAADNEAGFCLELARRVTDDYKVKLEVVNGQPHKFLFPDIQELVRLELGEFKTEVTCRVENHEAELKRKAEEMREKISAEEKAKAEQKRLDELQAEEDARIKAKREAEAKTELEKAEKLKQAAASINESALRAETNEEMHKEQAQAAAMAETAKQIETKANATLSGTICTLGAVLSALKKQLFITTEEAEQLIVDCADEIEKLRYKHMHDELKDGITASGNEN